MKTKRIEGQIYWPNWWRLWPFYNVTEDIVSVPALKAVYRTEYVFFGIGPFQFSISKWKLEEGGRDA